jgi:transmembrane sensor
MTRNFQHVEDVISDDAFLGWYYQQSPEQVTTWEEWLRQHPEYDSLVKQSVSFMNELQLQEATVASDTEARLTQLHQRMDETAAPVVPIRRSFKRWWMSAAAVAVLLIGTFFYFQWKKPADCNLGTAYGQVSSNELPDGSTMILNANSTAKLSENWSAGTDREVWLNGEAFFKVTKTAEKSRFIVHTNNLDVIVTGTQFNVMHRDDKTSVLLTEGSVIIRTRDGKEVTMKPGDFVEMAGQLVKTDTAKQENILAWKENKMAFDNISVKDAAHIISNHYGVKVKLGDSAVGAKMLNGMMPNDKLEDLLAAIEVAINIRITRTGEEITFSSVN